MTWARMAAFWRRWFIWLSAGAGIVFALLAVRRANERERKARAIISDKAADAIVDEWDDVDDDVARFLDAQDRANKANEKLSKQLDKIAASQPDAASIISDWNAANRLRDDA